MVPRHDLTDQVALRIGMASRQLDGVDLSDWMAILIRAVGLPLSPQRLGRLRLNRLRQASKGQFDRFSDDQLRSVIALLRGHGVDIRQSVPAPPGLRCQRYAGFNPHRLCFQSWRSH